MVQALKSLHKKAQDPKIDTSRKPEIILAKKSNEHDVEPEAIPKDTEESEQEIIYPDEYFENEVQSPQFSFINPDINIPRSPLMISKVTTKETANWEKESALQSSPRFLLAFIRLHYF